MDEHYTPEEQAVIERLEQAPQPTLSNKVVARLHQRVLEQVDLTPAFQRVQVQKRPFVPRPRLTFVAASVVAALIGIVLLSGLLGAAFSTAPVQTPGSTFQVASADQTQTAVPVGTTDNIATNVTPNTTLEPSTIAIQGVVQAISGNIITVNNMQITVAPDDPMLRITQVGDIVHVEAVQDNTEIFHAVQISNIVGETTSATTFLEGRVEAINEETIVINGITIQLPADDPRRKELEVGTFLSIDGYFEGAGANSIMIIVKITVVAESEVDVFIQCKGRRAMGMGDVPPPPAMGMGMGDDGMGMGEPQPAMGMGDAPDGMGMGMGEPDCK